MELAKGGISSCAFGLLMVVAQLSWWGLGSCNSGHDGSSAVELAGVRFLQF